MKKEDLQEILELHKLWLAGEEEGKKAKLQGANLREANLRKADLDFLLGSIINNINN